MNAIEQQNLNAWYSMLPVDIRRKWTELVQQVHTMRMNGKIIYPAQEDIFNALKHCHPLEVKAVIVGQDPYHGDGQAMGMSFSVRDRMQLPKIRRFVKMGNRRSPSVKHRLDSRSSQSVLTQRPWLASHNNGHTQINHDERKTDSIYRMEKPCENTSDQMRKRTRRRT